VDVVVGCWSEDTSTPCVGVVAAAALRVAVATGNSASPAAIMSAPPAMLARPRSPVTRRSLQRIPCQCGANWRIASDLARRDECPELCQGDLSGYRTAEEVLVGGRTRDAGDGTLAGVLPERVVAPAGRQHRGGHPVGRDPQRITAECRAVPGTRLPPG